MVFVSQSGLTCDLNEKGKYAFCHYWAGIDNRENSNPLNPGPVILYIKEFFSQKYVMTLGVYSEAWIADNVIESIPIDYYNQFETFCAPSEKDAIERGPNKC